MRITNVRIDHIPIKGNPWIDNPRPRFSFTLEGVPHHMQSVPWALTLYAGSTCLWQQNGTGSRFLFIPCEVSLSDFTEYRLEVIAGACTRSFPFRTAYTHSFPTRWIAAPDCAGAASAPVFRYRFSAENIVSATLLICGLGLYDVRLGGKRITRSILDPPHSVYHKRTYYRAFDILPYLKADNLLTVELGNGFYNDNCSSDFSWDTAVWRNKPRLFALLRLVDPAGNITLHQTDSTWSVSLQGPTVYNSIYVGEHFDARLDPPAEDSWVAAQEVQCPTESLPLQLPPFLERIHADLPAEIRKIREGQWLVTAAHTTSGMLRVGLRGTRGCSVRLLYAEKLGTDGLPCIDTSYEAVKPDIDSTIQTDVFLCRGGRTEYFEPKFSYKGFRYVLITSDDPSVFIQSVKVISVRNALQSQLHFRCSEPILCTLHENMIRTLRNNFHWKPTDTPMYEKNGWLGDAGVALDSMMYNFDSGSFLLKWLHDIRDSQREDGLIALIAPTASFGFDNDTVWTSAYFSTVFELYRHTGDKQLVHDFYPSLCRLADQYLRRLTVNNWMDGSEYLADWLPPSGNCHAFQAIPPEGSVLVGSAYSFRSLQIMTQFAEELQDFQRAEKYRLAAEHVRTSIQKHCFSQEKGMFFSPQEDIPEPAFRQTSNIVPVVLGIADRTQAEQAVSAFVSDVAQQKSLDTGMVGTKYALPLLTKSGQTELAYQIATKTTYPSWGYWVTLGADTMWEAFEQNARSRDHFFLGTIDDWLLQWVAGIRDVQNAYESFTINPCLDGQIQQLTCSIRTPRGRLSVQYDLNRSNHLYLRIPFGSTATVTWQGCTTVFLHGNHAL